MSNDRYEEIRKALEMGPTPGPWVVRYDYLVQARAYEDGRLVPVAQPYGVNCLFANARLIAACDPDTIRELLEERDALAATLAATEAARDELLEALRMVMACAGAISEAPDGLLEMALDDDDEETRIQANAFLVARAAIAKATGVQHE